MKIGYARVSTEDQNLEIQVSALEKAGCEKVYMEKISGTKKNRPELEKLLDNVRPGDRVIDWKLDRLGRSTKDLIEIVTTWRKEDISFQSLSDGITFDNSSFGKMIFTVLAAFAELERDLISERTKAGLAHARKMGRIGGRRPGLSSDAKIKAAAAAELYKQDTLTAREIAKQLNIATSTLYKYLKYMGVKNNSSINPLKPSKMKKQNARRKNGTVAGQGQ